MSPIEQLTQASGPLFLTGLTTSTNLSNLAREWQDSGLLVRAIRGEKARTVEGLFDEFAAAFQFPPHFGENWDAFRDCIADLDWLSIQSGVIAVIYSASQVLRDADTTELATFVRYMSTTAAEFAEAVADGEWWDRPPVPFHVVLQGESVDELKAWRAAGAVVVDMPVRLASE